MIYHLPLALCLAGVTGLNPAAAELVSASSFKNLPAVEGRGAQKSQVPKRGVRKDLSLGVLEPVGGSCEHSFGVLYAGDLAQHTFRFVVKGGASALLKASPT